MFKSILLTILATLALSAQEKSFDFKGIKVGMPYQEYKTTYKPNWLTGLINNLSFVGSVCSVKGVEGTKDGQKILESFFITIHSDNYLLVLEACKAKFGEPTSVTDIPLQNGYGAQMTQTLTEWKNSTTWVKLYKYHPYANTFDTNTTSLNFWPISMAPTTAEVKKVLSDM